MRSHLGRGRRNPARPKGRYREGIPMLEPDRMAHNRALHVVRNPGFGQHRATARQQGLAATTSSGTGPRRPPGASVRADPGGGGGPGGGRDHGEGHGRLPQFVRGRTGGARRAPAGGGGGAHPGPARHRRDPGWMQEAAEAADGRDVRFVLVSDGLSKHQALRAVTYGLVSVIPSRDADFEQVVRAIAAVREGRVALPDVAQGWLEDQIRTTWQLVLEPRGLTATGLERREVDVLRLLARGLGTQEIAQDLNYSERTVKNIIHGVLTRLKLRNRTHAVAFAMQHGAL
ncbi:response regulator transcription factor [Streptacidiphilus sp. 4-A2]|nr:response regulator transcription factor [Streptacidiphilus sp. 4-A2]